MKYAYLCETITEKNLEFIQRCDPNCLFIINYSGSSWNQALNHALRGKLNIQLQGSNLGYYSMQDFTEILTDLKPTELHLNGDELTHMPIPWTGLKHVQLRNGRIQQETVDSWIFSPELESFSLVPNYADVDYSRMLENLLTSCPNLDDLGIEFGDWCSDELFDRIIEKIHATRNFWLQIRVGANQQLTQERFERLAHPNLSRLNINNLSFRVQELDVQPFLKLSTNTELTVYGCKRNVTQENWIEYFIKTGKSVDGNSIEPDRKLLRKVDTVEYKVMMAVLSAYGRVGTRSLKLRSLHQELFRLLADCLFV